MLYDLPTVKVWDKGYGYDETPYVQKQLIWENHDLPNNLKLTKLATTVRRNNKV